MAEANTANEKRENKRNDDVINKRASCGTTLRNLDVFYILFSFGTYVADISTDIILVIEYSLCGHFGWAVGTLLLMLLPASVVQLFSLRWHKLDNQITLSHYIFHVSLLGVVQRYYAALRTGLEVILGKNNSDLQKLHRQQSDLCILHLLSSLVESVPQLVLQFYISFVRGEWRMWTSVSVGASLCSVVWAVAVYPYVTRRCASTETGIELPLLILQAVWRSGMLLARVAAVLVFVFLFHYWIFLVMGLHWVGVTTWTILQNTDEHSNWEDRLCNGIIGLVYCFSYFHICGKCSKTKVFTFYLVLIIQNIACLILALSFNIVSSAKILIVTGVFILGGTVVGFISLTLYYMKLHPGETISCSVIFRNVEDGISQRQKQMNGSPVRSDVMRSLRHLWTVDRNCLIGSIENLPFDGSPNTDGGCADKKLLLENWIGRSGSPTFASVPISQDPVDIETSHAFEDVEFHTIVNSPDASFMNEGFNSTEENTSNIEKLNNEKQKRRGICSPTQIGLTDLNEELKRISFNSSALNCQKRRGICSSDQLVLDFNSVDGAIYSVIDVNLNDDVKLKRRPIYSVGSAHSINSDLSSKTLYSVKLIKLCDDRNLRPEEYVEVASEVLSAHDYENICAVNIARERWGIRSWEGYTDIETFLHDDSTVRDRRRDTLTSTFTGTSASSEISSSDRAGSPPLARPRPRQPRTRQDDYLDTLVYDLVDCDRRRVHFLDFNEHDHELDSNVFIAKPYVVDQHGTLFPLGPLLEPIEELEEPVASVAEDVGKRQTQSSLVATIDEIRRGNETDSPRHVYHRTENVWDDDVSLMKVMQNITTKSVVKSLWNNQPGNKQNANSQLTIFKHTVDKLNLENSDTSNHLRPETDIKMFENCKKINTSTQHRNKTEEGRKNSPKKSVCEGENIKNKKNENKPRRKFSLLREKFEPKAKQDDILESCTLEMGSTVNLIDDLKSAKYSTSVITKVVQWNSAVEEVSCVGTPTERAVPGVTQVVPSLRDKRNLFLKQVLSPPKFHNRKKMFNKT